MEEKKEAKKSIKKQEKKTQAENKKIENLQNYSLASNKTKPKQEKILLQEEEHQNHLEETRNDEEESKEEEIVKKGIVRLSEEETSNEIKAKNKNKRKQTDKKTNQNTTKQANKQTSKNISKKIKKIEMNYLSILTDKENPYYEFFALSLKYKKFVGAHVSASGGVHTAPLNCFSISGQAFALFLKNQRRWDSSPLDVECVKKFKEICKTMNFNANKFVLPHSSYLINLANPDSDKRQKSYQAFLDDLKRCELLDIKMCNFHPGSTVGSCERKEGIRNIAESINKAHKETDSVKCIIENMSGQKNMIASNFIDIKEIIELVENKNRIGVCLDTCHLFAAGYDIRTKEAFDRVLKEFDSVVGLRYLSAMHLNDSKSKLGSGLDRHENIGKGFIGVECFKFIMQDERFENIPLVLETPDVAGDMLIWKHEIQTLYSFLKSV